MPHSLYLIATIDGARVAIESDLVESVVHVHEVIPVPQSNPSVAGLFALRSRVLTLIDSQYLVTGKSLPTQNGTLAIIAEISGHHFGLLVESVEDVVSISLEDIEKQVRPASKWASLSTGIVEVGGQVAMIIDPAALVTAPQQLAA
jgi:purine-binding chemotaxis protein CheW